MGPLRGKAQQDDLWMYDRRYDRFAEDCWINFSTKSSSKNAVLVLNGIEIGPAVFREAVFSFFLNVSIAYTAALFREVVPSPYCLKLSSAKQFFFLPVWY